MAATFAVGNVVASVGYAPAPTGGSESRKGSYDRSSTIRSLQGG